MFDIGFSELLLIGVVALVVLGPERLPKVARTIGHLVGRMQRYAANIKAEIDREMKLEELKKIQEQFRQAEAGARHVILEEKQAVEQEIGALSSAVESAPTKDAGEPVSPPPEQGKS
ncbi:MAG: Sec-independent protein translocase protein TatB [Sulfuricellaceae bacterium]|jgi:sec-independent protein translocase protein TatB